MKDYNAASLELHEKYQGKLDVVSVVPVTDRETLSTIYTPGVAAPCLAIAKDSSLAKTLTIKGRTVAVVTDAVRRKHAAAELQGRKTDRRQQVSYVGSEAGGMAADRL